MIDMAVINIHNMVVLLWWLEGIVVSLVIERDCWPHQHEFRVIAAASIGEQFQSRQRQALGVV